MKRWLAFSLLFPRYRVTRVFSMNFWFLGGWAFLIFVGLEVSVIELVTELSLARGALR